MSLTCVLCVVDLQLFCCRCNFALFQLFSNFADDDDDNDGNYDDDDDNYVSIYDDDDGKGTPHLKKNVFFRALPKLPLPPQIWQVLCIQKRERAEILLLCAEKLPFLGSVQKYYYPGTRCPWSLVQGHFSGS